MDVRVYGTHSYTLQMLEVYGSHDVIANNCLFLRL